MKSASSSSRLGRHSSSNSNAAKDTELHHTAATLHKAGRTSIASAAEAAEALRPLAGDAATVLMALGLIGTGILAVPILTGSAGYAMCEAFGWNCSLDAKPGQAKEFYLILCASTSLFSDPAIGEGIACVGMRSTGRQTLKRSRGSGPG